MNGTAILVLVLLGMLALVGLGGWWIWTEMAEVDLGFHGFIALGLGVTATLLLGVGLMWLAYYSHKRGYDERVGRD